VSNRMLACGAWCAVERRKGFHMSITASHSRPGFRGPSQVYYAGSGRITVGGVAHAVGPETAVFVPSETAHRIENTGPGELRMTFTLSPPGYEEFFRTLARTQTDHASSPA
jgi:oxalate decarboxylase/phosphoglucose isomerase-like protein (cupin superfamily)